MMSQHRLMSRHGSSWPMETGVATPFEVATWAVLAGWKGGRDMGMMLQPGLLNLGSRHHFEVATWVGQCEVATWVRGRDLA